MAAQGATPHILRNGQTFWVREAPKTWIRWLRYGALALLLPVLLALGSGAGFGLEPEAPAQVLNTALLLILLCNIWMLLIDLLYRLAAREQHQLVSYLVALGIGAGLLLVVRVLAGLLDAWLSPYGHTVARDGLWVMLVLTAAAPLAKAWLLREPVLHRLALRRGKRAEWAGIEQGLRRRMRAHPEAVAPGLLLAEMLLLQGRLEEGLELVRHLTATHPAAWGGWAALGALALENEKWKAAASACATADEVAPRGVRGSIHLLLGLALLGVEQPEAAKAAILRSARWPLPPHLRHYRWFLLMRIGQSEQDPVLIYRATAAVKSFPKDAWAFLVWYEGVDRAALPALGEDLYEAADWTRHLLNIRRAIN